jgi:hypothetical protein
MSLAKMLYLEMRLAKAFFRERGKSSVEKELVPIIGLWSSAYLRCVNAMNDYLRPIPQEFVRFIV